MKILNKMFTTIVCIAGITFAGFTQGVDDAKKAIAAEQYQKAKSLLKNLTATHADESENFFYLGWIYLISGQIDSAEMQFTKGIAVETKSSLNYAGLGATSRMKGNQSAMLYNFDMSLSLAKKTAEPYLYIGKSYLLESDPDEVAVKPDPDAAIKALSQGIQDLRKVKNAELLITLGDANLAKLNSNEAYRHYSDALSIEPKSPAAHVALGKLWRLSNSWETAYKEFQTAISIDPNFGPAYREWGETEYREARANRRIASDRIKSAVEHYQKYLSLTDKSPESQLRYADFLLNAGDYQTLQQVADKLSNNTGANLRVYRYLGYAAYENKNYEPGLVALNKFMTQATPKRIIARDYLYLGRLQVKTGQDSTGMINMAKAAQLDSNLVNAYSEIGNLLYTQKKYAAAGDAYRMYTEKAPNALLNDYFREGLSYYFAYSGQYFNNQNNKEAALPDSNLLALADSALSHVQQKTASKPVADVLLYRARVNDLKDADRAHMQAFAKPFYEQYIALKSADSNADKRVKKNLSEAYAYLGAYYKFQQKDEALAKENYEKARVLNPDNAELRAYFDSETPVDNE